MSANVTDLRKCVSAGLWLVRQKGQSETFQGHARDYLAACLRVAVHDLGLYRGTALRIERRYGLICPV